MGNLIKPQIINQNRRKAFVMKVKKEVTKNTTVDRLIPLYRFAWFSMALFTLATLTVSFFHLYLSFNHMAQDYRVALIFASVVVVAIGSYLTFALHYNLKMIFFGWARNYVFVTALFSLLSVAVLSYSVFLDVKGMEVISVLLSKDNAESSIAAKYDSKIADLTSQKKDAMSQKWKGNTTRKGMQLAQSTDDQIRTQEAEKTRALTEAKSFSGTYSSFTKVIAGISQLILLASLCFIVWFEKQVADEEDDTEDDQRPAGGSSGHKNLTPQSTEPGPITGFRHPIGFMAQVRTDKETERKVDTERLQPVATAKKNTEQIDVLLKAWKNEKSVWNAWRSKKRSGTGTAETNNRQMDAALQRMCAIETQLIELGYDTSALVVNEE